MQEKFNKELEEIQKSQSILNNAITDIKSTLEGTNSRITEAEVIEKLKNKQTNKQKKTPNFTPKATKREDK